MHLAAVGFVVIAGEMEQSMEDEDLDLRFGGVPEFGCIGGRDLGGDGNVSPDFALPLDGFEAQDVSRLVLVPVLAVHPAEFVARGNKNHDLARQSDGALGLACEQGQGPLANPSRLVN